MLSFMAPFSSGFTAGWGATYRGEQGCWGHTALSLPATLPQGNPQQPPTTLFPLHCLFHEGQGSCRSQSAIGAFKRDGGKDTVCVPWAPICHSYNKLQHQWVCSKLVCCISASKTYLCTQGCTSCPT